MDLETTPERGSHHVVIQEVSADDLEAGTSLRNIERTSYNDETWISRCGNT